MGNVNGRYEIEDDNSFGRSRPDADDSSVDARGTRSVDSVDECPPESPGRSRTPLMFAPQYSKHEIISVPESFLLGLLWSSSYRKSCFAHKLNVFVPSE
ncbi:hypothetical protein ZIOFF_067821 [Zingiber officinale]|uniref:Uncharacterized protein n=1 Tax=Zingiber officinale TaxID=94328 RepID=A0A8J5C7C8_ZINOF|nr:hypothetical protein ZIOFF_067821 [Zingiber officinale]